MIDPIPRKELQGAPTQREAELMAQISKLRIAIKNYLTGDAGEFQIGESYRDDGEYSKHDKCVHGRWRYEECENCVGEYFQRILGDDEPPDPRR